MLAAQLPAGIDFRPTQPEDEPFLAHLYASTREAELAFVPWSAAEKSAFLAQQFQFQHRYYQAHFSGADFHIVQRNGVDIGRRYVLRSETGIVLIDMALLPPWRGQGIGTAILHGVLGEAHRSGRTVTLHVEHDNPAGRLYSRSGFVGVGDNGVYRKMQWTLPRFRVKPTFPLRVTHEPSPYAGLPRRGASSRVPHRIWQRLRAGGADRRRAGPSVQDCAAGCAATTQRVLQMSEPFLGEIRMVGFNYAPAQWAFCQGQSISIAQNSALFSLLGTTFGGNGMTTFNLPDSRGHTPVGMGMGMGMGNGPGLTPIVQGEMSGNENVTILSTQMPAHNHAESIEVAGVATIWYGDRVADIAAAREGATAALQAAPGTLTVH